MKKKLYFVVEKEIASDGESQTGNKNITVYEIVDNEPKIFTIIDAINEDNSKEMIQDYLNDNGFDDEDYVLKQL